MNKLLKPFLCQFIVVFFDDILVYNKSFKTHLLHLNFVLSASHEGKFYLKFSKFLFAQQKLEYQGHIVSQQGVAPESSKINSMLEWPSPFSTTFLYGFLGLAGFYRKFVKGYATIAAPLNSLLRKDQF